MRVRALLFELQDVVHVVKSRKLWFSKKPLSIFTGSTVADGL